MVLAADIADGELAGDGHVMRRLRSTSREENCEKADTLDAES